MKSVTYREGHYLCPLCPDRIEKLSDSKPFPKGDLHTRAHIKCIRRITRKRKYEEEEENEKSSSSTVNISPSPLPPTQLPLRPLTFESSPLESFRNQPKRMFDLYDYAFIPPTTASTHLAYQLVELYHSMTRNVRKNSSTEIAGEVKQIELDKLGEAWTQLYQEWKKIVSEVAISLGINMSDLHFIAPKLLSAAPNKGQQEVHCDSSDGWLAREKYSCLLYCSTQEGIKSTAMPRFPPQFKQFYTPQEGLLETGSNELRKKAYLWDKEWYHQIPIECGSMMIFRQSTPHFGIMNRTSQDRLVLFTVLSPDSDPNQDSNQLFRWIYFAYAFGEESKEFAESLVHSRIYNPLGRYDQETYEKAINCLRKWNLYDTYFKCKPEVLVAQKKRTKK